MGGGIRRTVTTLSGRSLRTDLSACTVRSIEMNSSEQEHFQNYSLLNCRKMKPREKISFKSHVSFSTAPVHDSGNEIETNQDNPLATGTTSTNENVVPFLLADIGEGIKEVEVLQWHVKVGDEVQEFDTICQVQSDKATVEITSRFAGTIKEINSSSSKIQVGEPLVYIQTKSSLRANPLRGATLTTEHVVSDIADQIEPAANETSVLDSSVSSTNTNTDGNADYAGTVDNNAIKYMASPAVRKLIADNDIEVRKIQGTGPKGRILKADILQFMHKAQISTTEQKISSSPPPQVPLSTTVYQEDEDQSKSIVALTGYYKFMVQSMTESLQIPHMGLGDEIVVDKLLEFRKNWNDSCNDPTHKLGLLTILIKACSIALKEYPSINAKVHNVDECQVSIHQNHDIGAAMDTAHGLVVPVIRNVQDLSLVEIQLELDRLKESARSGNVELKDLVPSPTFTLSNIGGIGVGSHMSPVLVPPMIAMGALGRIQKLPRFDEDDNVTACHILYASWAADHRFLDGATLARFHQTFAKYASDPMLMLPHLK